VNQCKLNLIVIDTTLSVSLGFLNSCSEGKFSTSQGQKAQLPLGKDTDAEASKNPISAPEEGGQTSVQTSATTGTTGTTPSTPTAVVPLVECKIDPRIQFQALTQIVPEGTYTATGTKTLNLPADATDIKISLLGYSVDDHSVGLVVNGVNVLSMAEASNTVSYNKILTAPLALTSLKAGANTITGSAGENPKYNRGTGHIGAGFCFQGTYRASVCKSEIGVENPRLTSGGCGQP
jgi:hypothetical protein